MAGGLPPINLNNVLAQARLALGLQPVADAQPLINPAFASMGDAASGLLFRDAMSMNTLMQNGALRLNALQLSTFLKDAMKLPTDMKQLLLALANPDQAGKPMAELLKEAPEALLKNLIDAQPANSEGLSVPIDNLQALLNKNLKDASQSLNKLLQSNLTSQTQGGRQVAELMSDLGKLSETAAQTPQRALQTLMLLYLPWYPLALHQKLEVGFQHGGEEESGSLAENAVILYLHTNTLGAFRIKIREMSPLQIHVEMAHEPLAAPWLESWETLLNETLSRDGLPAALWDPKQGNDSSVSSHTQTVFDAHQDFAQATRQEDKKAMQVHQTGSRVSVLVLSAAYSLSRLIFETDEANRPLHKT